MASLLFKKGLHENLSKATFAEGTVYITTDERAMYVDTIDADGVESRIRIQGSVLYYSTLQEFYNNEKPPYSTDVIYFIEKDSSGNQFNALMRWNPTGGDNGTGAWVQLNATADSVQGAIDTLQKQISTNADNISQLITNLDTVTGYVGEPAKDDGTAATGLHLAVANAQSAAGAAQAAADKAQGEVDALEQVVGTASEGTEGTVWGNVEKNASNIATNAGKIGDLTTTAADHEERIAALEEAEESAPKATKEELKALADIVGTASEGTEGTVWENVEQNAADIATKASNDDLSKVSKDVSDLATDLADNYATKTELNDAKTTLQGNIDTINAELGDPSEGTTGTVWANIESNTDRIAEVEKLLGSSDDSSEGSIVDRVEQLENRADAQAQETERLAGILEGATEGDTGLVGDVAQNTSDIAQNAADIAKNAENIAANAGNISKNAEQIQQNVDDIATNAGKIEDLKKALDEAASTYATKTELADAKTELKTHIDEHILAANAMRYMGSVASETELSTKVTENGGASIGDTYIATSAFKLTSGEQVYAGDLLVAEGEEDASTGKITTIEWTVVDTGYIEQHENRIELIDGNKIALYSHLDGELGVITIQSASENIKVATDTENQALSLSLEWAEF